MCIEAASSTLCERKTDKVIAQSLSVLALY
jgi:hypothetical protein